jgi:hypothetical protein
VIGSEKQGQTFFLPLLWQVTNELNALVQYSQSNSGTLKSESLPIPSSPSLKVLVFTWSPLGTVPFQSIRTTWGGRRCSEIQKIQKKFIGKEFFWPCDVWRRNWLKWYSITVGFFLSNQVSHVTFIKSHRIQIWGN